MFERFTAGARAVVVDAGEQARTLGHDVIGTQDVLLALLGPSGGTASRVLQDVGLRPDRAREIVRRRTPANDGLTEDDAASLRSLGIDLELVLARLEEAFGPDAVPRSEPRPARYRLSRPAKKALQLALREAIWLRSSSIATEHLLLGLLRCDDTDVIAVLAEIGAVPDDVRNATLRAIGRAA
jgi:ATP-dependent Clp protease ATP-binding subunit ClpA